ncbi:hypothetical protein EIP86_005752 [Pleurotus ostreatoroseus]|nr:hypothetical protein EIP86_005752 [Pleurotus ostreatoroseus]
MSRAGSVAPTQPPATEPAAAAKLRALSPQPNGEDAPTPTPLATIASTSATPAPDAAPSTAPTPAADPDEKEEAEENEKEEEDDASAEPKIIVDEATFNQILELDEDDTFDFSTEMVIQYFQQATTTFEEMQSALDEKDLPKLSSLGHFLKGSSAALGVQQVQRSCERIQHYGKCWDEEAGKTLSEQEALDMITPLLKTVSKEYQEAEKWLKNWYLKKSIDLDKME